MKERLARQDVLAGGIAVLIGLVGVVMGRRYGMGTLGEIGPGLFPAALGALMMALGAALAGVALARPAAERPAAERPAAERPVSERPGTESATVDLRGGAFIIAGLAAFVVAARLGGLVPAAFACVFLAALGDRTATLRRSLVLAACVTVFGVVLFHYLLQVQMPLVVGWSR